MKMKSNVVYFIDTPDTRFLFYKYEKGEKPRLEIVSAYHHATVLCSIKIPLYFFDSEIDISI